MSFLQLSVCLCCLFVFVLLFFALISAVYPNILVMKKGFSRNLNNDDDVDDDDDDEDGTSCQNVM